MWQPIETAPKDGTWILLSVKPYDPSNTVVAKYNGIKWCYDEDEGFYFYGPAYWHELPPPPQD